MCAARREPIPNSTGWSQPRAHLSMCRVRPDQLHHAQGPVMKLLSFTLDGRSSYGALKDDGVVDLGASLSREGCSTLRQLLETDRLADVSRIVASSRPDHSLNIISFAPVIPDPGKIICVGLN